MGTKITDSVGGLVMNVQAALTFRRTCESADVYFVGVWGIQSASWAGLGSTLQPCLAHCQISNGLFLGSGKLGNFRNIHGRQFRRSPYIALLRLTIGKETALKA